jgi:hypothetical protein
MSVATKAMTLTLGLKTWRFSDLREQSEHEGAAPTTMGALAKNEILSMLPELIAIHHQERPVRDRGVVEYVASKFGNTRTPVPST